MADNSPLSTIRDLGNLGVARAQELPGEFATARQLIDQAMAKLQNPGWTVNAPLLAASLAMFKPTRAGGFGESLANAGEAGIPELMKQRQVELGMNTQLANLAKERGQLGVQEANALMSFPTQAAGLESALQDLRFYEMMRENNMPGGGKGKTGAGGAAIAGTAMAPGADQTPPEAVPSQGGQTASTQGSARQPAWYQALPEDLRGRVDNLARQVAVGTASGSKAGLDRAAQAQQLLQSITGPGWMFDPTSGGFVAVGEKDPGYIRKVEDLKNWSKVAPESQLHALKKAIDSGYEFVEITDENGQKRRITNEMAREALGYPGRGPASQGTGGQGGAPGAPEATKPSGAGGLPASDVPVLEKQTEDVAKYGTDLRHAYINNQKIAPRLERMYDILRDLESGSFAEKKGEIVAGLRSLGLNVPDTATANPAAVQKLLKETITSVFEQIKGVTSRPALQEFLMLQQANANPELQPAANAAILRQMLGLLDYENQVYKDYVGWSQKNPGTRNIDPFILDYAERLKPAEYTTTRGRSLGNVRGEPLPPKEELTKGTMYVLPNGTRATWDGEVFIPKGAK